MKKINVRKQGPNFLLNGAKTKLRMRTSFKFFGWLLHNNEGKARRWLERVKRQGFHGIRLFGEAQLWDGPFFGLPPVVDTYDWNMPAGSGFKLTNRHKAALRKLVELLQEYEMVAEFTAIATLKDPNYPGDPRDDIVAWNSHLLRATAVELNTIREQMGTLNMLFETYNEANAHSVKIPWYEMHQEARRWKVRDLPNSLISISHGDHWDYHYDVGNGGNEFSHCVVHTPRNGQWWKIEEPLRTLQGRVGAFPVYLNENIHYMTQEQWDYWVPKHPNWGGLSTTDWARIQQQWNTAYNLGASYCVHDLVGMASDPDVPETPLENEHRNQFGDGGGPPPPPPPPPPPSDLCSGPLQVEASSLDPLGRLTFTIRYPDGLFPLLIEGGYERNARPRAGELGGEAIGNDAGVLRCRYTVPLGGEYEITDISTFHGLARADIVEMDTFVYDGFNRMIYHRSDHKEVPGNYDAYNKQVSPAITRNLHVHHNLRVNGRNEIFDRLMAVGHFGTRIYARKAGIAQPIPGPTPPPPVPDYSGYVKYEDVEELQHRIKLGSNIWSGVRDPNHVAAECEWAFPEVFGIDKVEMKNVARAYLLMINEGIGLSVALEEHHPAAVDRSAIEKARVNTFLRKQDDLNDIVNAWRETVESWPGAGTAYDSIAGWCDYCNEKDIREP